MVRLICLACAVLAEVGSGSCRYLGRHLNSLSPLLCGEAKKCAGTERSLMSQILNNPDVRGQNWSKLTVYPGTERLQPPAKIKGNVWELHLVLNNRGKMLKHTPTGPCDIHWTLIYFKA